MTYFYSQDWCCLRTYYSSSCMYFVQCRTCWCMFNYFFKVSHYNVGCCASLYGLVPTQKGSLSILSKGQTSSSHVSVATLQHHNRTHLKFQTWGCALWYVNVHLLCTGSDAEWRNFSLFHLKTLCFKGICSFKTGDSSSQRGLQGIQKVLCHHIYLCEYKTVEILDFMKWDMSESIENQTLHQCFTLFLVSPPQPACSLWSKMLVAAVFQLAGRNSKILSTSVWW